MNKIESPLPQSMYLSQQMINTVHGSSSLCGAVGKGLKDSGGHPPDQRHRPRHDLLPLVLRVLPHRLPGRLPRLQALVTPDVLKNSFVRSISSSFALEKPSKKDPKS